MSDVEVIDLTDETTPTDETITLDDTITINSPEQKTKRATPDYPPLEPSPLPASGFGEWEDDSSSDGCDKNNDSSSTLPSRINSSFSSSSSLLTPSPSYKLNPSPKKKQQSPIKLGSQNEPSPSQPKQQTKRVKLSAAQKLADKQAKEEAKRLKLKEKEAEKLQREANRANAANKALDNCTTYIDQKILKLIDDPEELTLKTLFDESMIRYRLTEYPKLEHCITWTYKRTEIVDGEFVANLKDANWIIVILPGFCYLKRLLAYKADSDDPQSIKGFLTDLRSKTGLDIILMVYNLANLLKNERAKEAKNYRKNFKNRFEAASGSVVTGANQSEITTPTLAIGGTELQELRLMLEMEFKHEHPYWKMHIEFYEKTNEIVQALARYSSSIAKLEVKQKARSSTGLDWAINMDKDKAYDPTKSSEDLTKLWITQLQQFTQITLPIAKAIAAEYPSPLALLDQYKSLTKSEAEGLLASLYVQRNLRRQIGINISKRIHCFMTCEDPDVHIGLS